MRRSRIATPVFGIGIFIGIFMVLSSPVASAETIRYSMTGMIAAINIDNTFVEFVDSADGIAVGNPFQASFTFDKSVPDGFFTDPTVGSYLQTVPPFDLSVTMGDLTLSTSDRAFSLIQVENHASGKGLDGFNVSATTLEMSSGWSITSEASNTPAVNFSFRDFSGRALTSKRLSELPVLDLSMFPESDFLNSFEVTLLQPGDVLSFPGGSVSAVNSMSIFLQAAELTTPSARVWIGLANSDDVGIKFDMRAKIYADTMLVGSGELNSVTGGSSGFNNAKLAGIPLTLTVPADLPAGTTFSMKLYVRNACSGSGKNSGRARLWYGDAAANSRLVTTINDSALFSTFYLLDGFDSSTSPGSGPKKTIDVAAGAKCSPFKLFGTWAIAMP